MYDLFKYICTDYHILNKSKPEFYILIALAISDNQNVLNNQRSIIQAKTNILVQLKKKTLSVDVTIIRIKQSLNLLG